jgi:iron complex outermembrane recepter protein
MKPILSFLLILCCWNLEAQLATGQINGKVNDHKGHALPYAHLIVKGTSIGTVSNETGYFSMKVPVGQVIVKISSIGYQDQELTLEVQAQQAAEVVVEMTENAAALAEYVVKANDLRQKSYVSVLPSESLRLNAPLIEVPQNIAVVNRQMMQDFGVLGTAEMARMTSGVTRRYGSANDFAFNIRGTDATNNNFRNGVGGYWWNQQADAFMLERVEFIKGPAGFMIGNAEPGGMLNEVTKQADGREVRELELGAGSWNLFRAGVDLGGKFSANSKFSYRLVAGGQHTNSFFDFYRSYRTYLLPSLRYTYATGSYLQAEMIRMDGHVLADNANNISRDGYEALLPRQYNASDPKALQGVETDDQYFRLSHVHQLGRGWQLKSQLAQVNGVFRGDGMYVSRFTPSLDTLYREYWYTNWRNQLSAAQSFIDGKIKQGAHLEHSILIGLDYGKTSVHSGYADLNPDNWGNQFPIAVNNPIYNLEPQAFADTTQYPADDWGTEWLALYAQDHLKMFNKVVLTLAGRLSRTRAWASYDSTTVVDLKFTPRLGLTYLMGKNASIYTLYDEAFLPQTGRKADRTNARPLTGSNLELGFKAQLMRQKLALNAALFRTIKNNVLVQNPQTQFYEERGQITSQGFEVDLMGNLGSNWLISANYTYTLAEITQDADSSLVGFPNYAVAPHAGNAMLRYRFAQGRLKGFSLGLGAQFMGPRSAVWAGWTNPEDKAKSAPAYTLFDFNAAYETKKWAIRLNCFNLFNRQFMDNAWWNSAAEEGEQGYFNFTPNQPFNFRLSFQYRLVKD